MTKLNFRWHQTLQLGLLVLCLAAMSGQRALAGQKFGPLEISGDLSTQNLVRHPSYDKLQFIENRNTVRLRVDYDWLEKGRLIDRIDVPFIERSKLFVLYRGVYDGFYDIAPTDRQIGQTRFDDLVGGRITDLSGEQRTSLKFENRLREAYIDLKLKDAPVSFRLGRQQVIWGESDQFRLMDIWNPLDVTWHFQQDSWENLRIPLWLGKGLWDIGEIGPLSNAFLEVVYNPFDFQPGVKVDFLPQPWSLPFPNPLRPGQIQRADVTNLTLVPQFDLQGTSFRRGDFKRNPQEASEVGARFHFATPQGIELSMDYLYGRGRGVGAASPFAVQLESIDLGSGEVGRYQKDINKSVDPQDLTKQCGVLSSTSNIACVAPVNVHGKVIHPYIHIFGLTGNYFEGNFTSAVLRFETAYAMGEPVQTTDPSKQIPVTRGGRPVGSTSPFNAEKRDVWAGMLGVDRPTWIRFLNPKATWFLTAQFFWNYTTGGHIDQLIGNSGAGEQPYFGPIGQWVSGPFNGQVERQQDANPGVVGNGDSIRRWEHLITIGGTSFYRGGTVVPFVAMAIDPVNANLEALWTVDYFYSSNFIITLSQKYFTDFGSNVPSDDPWYAGGRFHRRDETGVKLTYQF